MSNTKRDRSPPSRKDYRQRDGGRKGRSRSRSPRFTGRDWKEDGVSNNTQREEEHLKRARLFVGNVESNLISRTDLIDVFSRHGEVLAVSIHGGYSFVQMDNEKNANRAVNYEHGAQINGCKINVEFSTAALKAGARFKRLPVNRSVSPPHLRTYPPPIPHPPSHGYPSDSDLIERERRLARVLALERELKQEMTYLGYENLEPSYSRRGGGADLIAFPTYPDSYTKKEHELHYTKREDIYGTTSRKLESPPHTISPRGRSSGDGYTSRTTSDRFGRYSASMGGYPDYGRGPQSSWQ